MQLRDSEIANRGRSERNVRRNEQSPSESGESGNSLARSRSRFTTCSSRDILFLGLFDLSVLSCLSLSSKPRSSACHGSVLSQRFVKVSAAERGSSEFTITALFTATAQRREIRDQINAAGMLRRATASTSSVHPLHPPCSCSRERSHCLR